MMRRNCCREKSSTTVAAAAAETSTEESDGSEFIGMTGGEIFNEMMKRHDVEQIFGYPGGAILPVYDAIHNSKHFNFTLPRHEQGGGHMAEGYARATGKPGVCVVTSGPGATNMVTPLQDALMDGTPLVVFTGQVPTVAMGSDAFQEADVIGITRPCTKWNVLVKHISELPRRINEAFEVATSGRPGPVLVDLPKDVTAPVLETMPEVEPRLAQNMRTRRDEEDAAVRGQWTVRDGDQIRDEDLMARVGDAISNAKRPVIYAGQGVIQSPQGVDALRRFAESANVPVTTTLQGMGAFDELHPLSLHMLGMHGSAYANHAMQNADCIVALGARFDDRVTGNLAAFAPKTRPAAGGTGIVHFEISPKNVNKVVECDEVVLGDVGENLNALLSHVRASPRHEWFGQIAEWKDKYAFSYDAAPEGKIMPQQVLEEIERQLKDRKEDVYFTTGVGQHQMWAAQFIRWRHPRTFITSGGSGTMGFGVPAAIGAKLGLGKDKIVIDVDGDASFSMTCQEMLTAAEYQIGVKILVLNNNFQGMVKQWQDLFYEERHSGTPMVNPDFRDLANAMGCTGLRLDRPEDVSRVVEEFLACEGPVVLDAIVEKEEHVYPMVPAGKALDDMVYGPSIGRA